MKFVKRRVDAVQFEVLSTKLPSTWGVKLGTIALVTIGPKAWQEPNFWDNCNDQDPVALEIYRREAQKIYEEEQN